MAKAVLRQVLAVVPGRERHAHVDHAVAALPDIAVHRHAQLCAGVAFHVLAREGRQAQAHRTAVGAEVGRQAPGGAGGDHAAPHQAGDGVTRAGIRQQAARDRAAKAFELVAVAAQVARFGDAAHQVGHRKAHARGADVPLEIVAHKAEAQVGARAALAPVGQGRAGRQGRDLAEIENVRAIGGQLARIELDPVHVQEVMPVVAARHEGHQGPLPAAQAGDAVGGVLAQPRVGGFDPHLAARLDGVDLALDLGHHGLVHRQGECVTWLQHQRGIDHRGFAWVGLRGRAGSAARL